MRVSKPFNNPEAPLEARADSYAMFQKYKYTCFMHKDTHAKILWNQTVVWIGLTYSRDEVGS